MISPGIEYALSSLRNGYLGPWLSSLYGDFSAMQERDMRFLRASYLESSLQPLESLKSRGKRHTTCYEVLCL